MNDTHRCGGGLFFILSIDLCNVTHYNDSSLTTQEAVMA